MEAPASDEIRMEVPARGDFARIIRVAASAIAVRRTQSSVAIEDLRIAVDEALILLLAHSTPEGVILAVYSQSDEALDIVLRAVPPPPPADDQAVARFVELVGQLTVPVSRDAEEGEIRIRLVER